jgi:small basic protein (TIGR04137 family)
MSIHSSLRGSKSLVGERSVFTRIERLAALKKTGKFDEPHG